jgi:hypothetical protein
MQAAFEARSVDTMLTSEPGTSQLVAAGKAKVGWKNSADWARAWSSPAGVKRSAGIGRGRRPAAPDPRLRARTGAATQRAAGDGPPAQRVVKGA